VLPRSIATFEAFENAMSLDIAMGGSTNTMLHLLAAATRARSTSPWPTSTAVPQGAPTVQGRAGTPEYHMEDVHRAGGIPASWASWTAPVCCTPTCPRCTARPWRALDQWDIMRTDRTEAVQAYLLQSRSGGRSHPGRPSASPPAGHQLDLDRENGCIRDASSMPTAQDGGLAVLYGNLAENGCIVKTAGVDESILTFTGRRASSKARMRRQPAS
jgi:dihydroxy-acid dehydratase